MKREVFSQGTKEEIREALEDEIRNLSLSYTPEWKFTKENPDMGSVIALIFAEQARDVICKYQKERDRFCESLEEIMEIQPMSPSGARTVITMETEREDGVFLESRRKFLAVGEEADQIVFETLHPLYVTSAGIMASIAVSERAENVRITPWEEAFGETGKMEMFPEISDGCYRNEVILSHPYIFSGREGTVSVCPAGIHNNLYEAFWEMEGQRIKAEVLNPQQGVCKVRRYPGAGSLILSSCKKVPQEEWWEDVKLSFHAEGLKADFATDGEHELDREELMPFGREISLYSTCYLAQEEVFSQRGADITLSFTLEMRSGMRGDMEKEEKNLKVIRRALPTRETREVYIQELRLEYYNGLGFRRLKTKENITGLFLRDEGGKYTIRFICPEDWEPMEAGGYYGHLLRMQIAEAEGCYLFPAKHYYPVLKNIRVSCTYTERPGQKLRVRLAHGATEVDVTETLRRKGTVQIFPPFPYRGEQRLFCFDRPFGGSPVGMYFILRERKNAEPLKIKYEYLTELGFETLRTIDHTDGFRYSGVVLLMPEKPMAQRQVEGVCGYWIRITCMEKMILPHGPVIQSVQLGAAEAENREWGREQEYFLDETEPNMSFPAEAENLTGVKVMVNEGGGKVRHWHQRENFRDSGPCDRHFVLDKRKKRIRFSDGIKGRMPECTDGLTFSLRVSSCAGEAGNVAAVSIRGAAGFIPGIGDIKNPLPAFLGYSGECPEDLYRRVLQTLKNGGRIASEQDIVREALLFSREIAEAVLKKEGEKYVLYVLAVDFERGGAALSGLFSRLTDHLLSMGAAGGDKERLVIREPEFLIITVDMWVRTAADESSFDCQRRIMKGLYDYLHPVKEKERQNAIGFIPKEREIRRKLEELSGKDRVRYAGVRVRREDDDGIHESAAGLTKINGPAVCMNGEHTIHMEG